MDKVVLCRPARRLTMHTSTLIKPESYQRDREVLSMLITGAHALLRRVRYASVCVHVVCPSTDRRMQLSRVYCMKPIGQKTASHALGARTALEFAINLTLLGRSRAVFFNFVFFVCVCADLYFD